MWRITTEDGLKTNMVYDMDFDQDGKVWLGLFGGIASYNGHKVTMHAQHEDLSMSCTNLHFYGEDDIYFMNFTNEIFRYHRPSDSVYKIKNNPLEDLPSVGDYLFLNGRIVLQDEEHAYYGSISNDSLILDSARKITSRSKLMLSEPEQIPYSVVVEKKGTFTNDLLNHLTGAIDAKTEVDPEESIFYPGILNGGVFQHNGTKNQLSFIGENGHEEVVFNTSGIGDNGVLRAIFLVNGFYWLSFKSGIYVLDESFRLVEGVSQPLLSGQVVSGVDEDKHGNIWISTTKEGVFVIPNIFMLDLLANNKHMSKHVTQAVALKNGGWLLASQDNNVYEYGSRLRLKTKYSTQQNEVINGLVASEEQDQFWVSGHSGIEMFERNHISSFGPANSVSFILKSLGIKHLALTGNMLVAPAWSGVFLVPLKKGSAPFSDFQANYKFNHSYSSPRLQSERALYSFYDAQSNDLWIQHPRSPKIYGSTDTAFGSISAKGAGVAEFNVSKCVSDSVGYIWCASSDNGLLKVFERKVQKVYGVNDGLLSTTIFDMALDGDELWLATFKGLQKLNIITNTFTNYGVEYGVKELPYQTIAVGNDHVLISHSSASLLINKNELKPKVGTIPIDISNVQINKKDTLLLASYDLSFSENAISIWLSSFYYSVDKDFGFEYRDLNNGDGSWNYVPAEQGKLEFYNLKPGTYKWEFRAITSFGLASQKNKVIAFTILPPYYQTLWFQGLMGILILTIIGFVVTLRMRTKDRQNKLYREKATIETEKQKLAANLRAAQLSAIKAQLNPHFMFNALNSIQEFILLNHPVQANKFLGKFSDLMRLTLDNSNAETITLADELKMLSLYLELEGLRFEENFSYTIDNQVDHPASIEIPAMLIQPYVENAIKHGLLHKKENRELKVSFKVPVERQLTVVVEDNGVGRENAAKIKSMRNVKHKSYASTANQKRLELLNTGKTEAIALEIEDLVEDGRAVGTRITLRIPF